MIPQKRMECFRVLLEHLAWIEHQFLRGIRDSRKAGSLWGMVRGVGGVRKSWRQHPTKQQLYGHPPIQVRRTRHAGHCWRSRDVYISDIVLWTPSHGRAKTEWPVRTYIQQLCEDTGCSPGDLTEAMNDWEGWRERVREIRAGGMTRWWWWQVAEAKYEIILKPFFSLICLIFRKNEVNLNFKNDMYYSSIFEN